MNILKALALFVAASGISACAPTAAQMCESWKVNGLMPSPLENCRVCYDQLGGDDLNKIRSCAFSLDVNNAALGLQ